MKGSKKKLLILLGALSLSVISAFAATPSEASVEKGSSQTLALWTESEPHSMETKTSVAVSGTIEAVNRTAGKLTVKSEGGKKVDLTLDADTKVTLGTEAKSLADLTRGMKITARYAEREGKKIAITIEAEGKAKK